MEASNPHGLKRFVALEAWKCCLLLVNRRIEYGEGWDRRWGGRWIADPQEAAAPLALSPACTGQRLPRGATFVRQRVQLPGGNGRKSPFPRTSSLKPGWSGSTGPAPPGCPPSPGPGPTSGVLASRRCAFSLPPRASGPKERGDRRCRCPGLVSAGKQRSARCAPLARRHPPPRPERWWPGTAPCATVHLQEAEGGKMASGRKVAVVWKDGGRWAGRPQSCRLPTTGSFFGEVSLSTGNNPDVLLHFSSSRLALVYLCYIFPFRCRKEI